MLMEWISIYLKEFILSEMLMFYCAARDIFFIFEINVWSKGF